MSVKQSVKELLLTLSDRLDRVCNTSGRMTPPKKLYVKFGAGNFHEAGLEFFRFFLDFCDLKRDAAVLEVGCGIGRMAVPLMAYLSAGGTYDGFDPIKEGIDYCTSTFTREFPNFRFHFVDIRNGLYNPQGRIDAADFRFPFEAAKFDFVFSTSVFTHVHPPIIQHYLNECARVLRPGGRCLHTFFLLDEFAEAAVAAGKTFHGFTIDTGDFRTTYRDLPEAEIAVRESAVREMYRRAGLGISGVRYGKWSGRDVGLSWQDIVAAVK